LKNVKSTFFILDKLIFKRNSLSPVLIKLLKDKKIYKISDLSKRWKLIKNHWVFNIKFDSYYRSWLIAKIFCQIKEIDFDELFSTVVHYETTYLFLAVAALEDWNIYSINIKTVYLYGNLNKKIYVEWFKDFGLSVKEKKVW